MENARYHVTQKGFMTLGPRNLAFSAGLSVYNFEKVDSATYLSRHCNYLKSLVCRHLDFL